MKINETESGYSSLVKRVNRGLENRFLKWLKDFEPFRLFDALVAVHLFDIFTAWMVFHFHFGMFRALEINLALRSALIYGYWAPLIAQEIFLFSAFILTTLVLFWSKKRIEKYTGRHRLATIAMGFGLACLWVFPFAAATNLIRGFFPLFGLSPSYAIYFSVGVPVSLIFTRYGAGLRDLRVLVLSILPIIAVGFIILSTTPP